jgi:DNA-binding NarL/FixJ family response regulator
MEKAGTINCESSSKIRLLVVDDHEVVRRGLTMVLGLEPDIEICGEARDGLEAVAVARQQKPDLVLMDLKLPGLNGLEAARTIKSTQPECRVLILTGIEVNVNIFEALQSGIDGYILKEVKPEELVQAVRQVSGGEAYLHPVVTRKVLKRLSLEAGESRPAVNQAGESLSERELQVLKGVALGQSNREIAEQLIVGEETVRTHLKSAFRKLRVNDRTHAVVMALKQGLIEL